MDWKDTRGNYNQNRNYHKTDRHGPLANELLGQRLCQWKTYGAPPMLQRPCCIKTFEFYVLYAGMKFHGSEGSARRYDKTRLEHIKLLNYATHAEEAVVARSRQYSIANEKKNITKTKRVIQDALAAKKSITLKKRNRSAGQRTSRPPETSTKPSQRKRSSVREGAPGSSIVDRGTLFPEGFSPFFLYPSLFISWRVAETDRSFNKRGRPPAIWRMTVTRPQFDGWR